MSPSFYLCYIQCRVLLVVVVVCGFFLIAFFLANVALELVGWKNAFIVYLEKHL